VPAGWRDEALGAKWDKVRDVRRVVTGALELERAEKRIGSSLQAHPRVYIEAAGLAAAVDGLDLAEIAITSGLSVAEGPPPAGAFTLDEVAGVGVVVENAAGSKCQRCWRVLPEVGARAEAPDICGRCADAVEFLGVPAQ
jgi:isoleucyl-tRNA synthetase